MIRGRSTFIEFKEPITASYWARTDDERLFERNSAPRLEQGNDGFYVHDTLKLKVPGAVSLTPTQFHGEVYITVPLRRLEIHTLFDQRRTTLYRRDADNVPSYLTIGDLCLFREGMPPHFSSESPAEAFRYHRKLVQRLQDTFPQHAPTITDVLSFHEFGGEIIKINSPSRMITQQEMPRYFH